jgi:hypothetical protein
MPRRRLSGSFISSNETYFLISVGDAGDAVDASDGPPAPPDAASDAEGGSDLEEIMVVEDIVSVLEKKEIFKLCGLRKTMKYTGHLTSRQDLMIQFFQADG